jgi:hypothetical protein
VHTIKNKRKDFFSIDWRIPIDPLLVVPYFVESDLDQRQPPQLSVVIQQDLFFGLLIIIGQAPWILPYIDEWINT